MTWGEEKLRDAIKNDKEFQAGSAKAKEIATAFLNEHAGIDMRILVLAANDIAAVALAAAIAGKPERIEETLCLWMPALRSRVRHLCGVEEEDQDQQ